MKTSNVVTVFLRHKGKILILRRSKDVGTYKGMWGAISGFIENDEEPVERAKKEIKEEAGLHEKDFEFLKEGVSFSFSDEELDIKWIIHPFLFRSKTGKIRIDREHFEYKWIEPEKLSEYFTVPRLGESLRRVF